MSTWGRDKSRGDGGRRSTARAKTTQRQPVTRSTAKTSSMPKSSDDPSGRRGERVGVELRGVVDGREHDFIGFGLIALGALLGLSVYFGLAGVVGTGIEVAIGWFTGVGRFAVPAALIAIGVAFVRDGKAAAPVRLTIGWVLAAACGLGFAHLINGPDEVSFRHSAVGDAGGWIGAVLTEPLRALLAVPGAVVVLLAFGVCGLLLITQSSLKTLAVQSGRGVGRVMKPLGQVARRTMTELSSLGSDQDDEDDGRRDGRNDGRGPNSPTGEIDAPGQPGLPPPQLYDGAGDLEDPRRAPRARRRTAATSATPEGGELAAPGTWRLPPLALLHRLGEQRVNTREVEARGAVLHESLSQHGVDTSLVGVTVGPTVTRYELELGAGVKVARVTTLHRDIAYAMAASDVRILAPIPGRSAIGIEVPNHTRQVVALGDLMASPEAAVATHPLDVAIGKDIAGKAVFLDLSTTPHLLIAGATGSGKSSALNCILTSLLMRAVPDDVRLILIDPKQVEMGQYNRLPHLLTQPVTDPKKAANALAWAVREMERRYDMLSTAGVRDIVGYNTMFDNGALVGEPGSAGEPERLPYIVVVVDELNDLMMVAARDVEDSITRIAQKARAVGIHLIVATQRPSVNVITGVIKANIPARVAFAVSSLTDSRVILDQPGAEKLVGKGDMLLLPGNTSVPHRVQGSWVSEEEIRAVVAHWREQAPETEYVSGVGDGTDDSVTATTTSPTSYGDDDDEEAALVRQAMELVVRSQLGSTSMLQRKLKVGFARAGRIMDLLEQRGVVGPSEGSKARSVLMTVEEFELLQRAEEA
ncbi:MAG: DNA translocase FtsK [Actinomycetota bacterium]|nr:DNA translocase FtsK [Actinomycetota bacterium]